MYNVLANAATNILQSSVNIRGSDYEAVPLLQYSTNTKEMQIEIQCKYLHCTHKRSRFTPQETFQLEEQDGKPRFTLIGLKVVQYKYRIVQVVKYNYTVLCVAS